ncbi:universal stress protein UspE [Testudinibacter sp. TR-2022]|uniref:universal stress protein UspE n=1 Tax=Testudinibacter sp. TR-2022 TaxID=2585029 RepID=UPI00111AA283|nr:universal stress protein UspE [Testudinibacter sp. TR-2022]TNH07555.1 universal stress protein UspE [Pasteurellaceae bacterium Phil11]TNH24042.1 universal stress protein UspE [Testudinibacter sp. TR-2022]TNH24073.1 universal stress protein UspE [Testudinibacter sp. TR-2022]
MHFNNILVVIDPMLETQPSLLRALHLAKQLKKADIRAKLTLFLSLYDFSFEMSAMLSAEERESMHEGIINQKKEWLEELIQQTIPTDSGIEIDTTVVWKSRDYEAILEQVKLKNHDLVVKVAKPAEGLDALIFTPTDWQLLRKCPCPILIVKEHEWQPEGRILVAVNVADDEEYHDILNKKLVDASLDLAKVLAAGNIHLATAYPTTPVNMAIDLPEFNPNAYTDSIRGQHLINMKALRQHYCINEDHTHVEEGLPEEVIPQVAEKIKAELVVLGTIGRTGLSAAFLGNTAEHVIGRLNCDVLAIKPDPYELEQMNNSQD